MMQVHMAVGGVVVAVLLGSVSALPAQEEGVPLPQFPISPTERPVIPLMEGWYANDDGTYTISFGYVNLNESDPLRIPVGEDNSIDPSEFEGMQPDFFLPGRHHGVFTVTLPADRRDEDVWWSIRNTHELDAGDREGAVRKIPGRAQSHPYELDMNPRPHGSLPPLAWFGSEDDAIQGPTGVMADGTRTVSVGSPITLSVHVRDVSEWDADDPGLQDTDIPVQVTWFEYQGPGSVEFQRHESTPVIEDESEDEEEEEEEPDPREIVLPEAEGEARVIARFSQPGEYVLRARVDNFRAPDSSPRDQCCWTNAYVRVNVTGR